MADMNNLGGSLSAQFRNLNGRHPGQWPIVPRLLCAFAVFLVVLIVAWFVEGDPLTEELAQSEQAGDKLKDEFKLKYQQAVNLDALIKQREQVEEYVKTMQKQLPSKAEMAALLEDINHAGDGHGLTMDNFQPGTVYVRDYYAELPITIKVTGKYHDIATFASDIANLSRIVTLNNLNVSVGSNGVLAMNATAKTFRYLDPEEVAAQRKTADKSKGAKK